MRLTSLLVAAGLALTACHAQSQPAPGDTAEARANLDKGKAFLAKNAHEPGVVVLPSGLQYKVVRSGPADGPQPSKGDEIKVAYTGSLLNGEIFDSTDRAGQPAVMTLDNLVPGWMEALPRMRPGDEWVIYLPPDLGYGPEGQPPTIPPASVLVFDLKLLGVLKASAAG